MDQLITPLADFRDQLIAMRQRVLVTNEPASKLQFSKEILAKFNSLLLHETHFFSAEETEQACRPLAEMLEKGIAQVVWWDTANAYVWQQFMQWLMLLQMLELL